MARPDWTGVYSAILTQMTPDGEIDLTAYEENLRFQLDAGVHGVIVGGSLGEAATLTAEEKLAVAESTRRVAGADIPVLLNIAEQVTAQAKTLVRRAESAGVDGFMLLPPMRYRADTREVLAYLEAIIDSTSLPFLIYNNPVDYGIEITVPMFETLLRHANVESVKESTRDTSNVTRLRNAFADRLRIMCGVDTIAFDELIAGADGWIGGLVNAFPKETVAIYDAVRAGDIGAARRIHQWFLPLLELDVHPKFVQYIKLAAAMAGHGNEAVRAPRLPLVGTEREKIEAVVKRAFAVAKT